MKSLAALWSGLRPRRYTTIVVMLVIWAGVASSLFAAISSDLRNREHLKGRSQIIANVLQVDDIRELKGNEQDTKTTAYLTLKDKLSQIRAANQDLRFVYLLGKNDAGNVFFYVDSETPGSKGYSSPGSIYGEASPQLIGAFSGTETFVEGPSRDHWGVWISSLTPIIDPETGQTIALAGIDTSAVNYYGQIALYAIVPLLLAAIPVAGLIRDIKIQSKEEEILQLKSQFVSIASHELRSPLTGILWAIQSMTTTGKNRMNLEQITMLGDMYRSVESSIATVNEILDYSIFERGQEYKMQHEVVELTAVVKQVVSTLTLGAHEKHLTIDATDEWPHTPIYIRGDVAALKRALMNIVSNAIKYSKDNSKIDLIYQHAGTEHILGIRDHGIGIPESEQQKVLQGYYRATNAAAIEVHGTGLGLWVTKKIIEQHGGRLWLESALNKGTTVYVAFPVEEYPTAATRPAQKQPADSTPQHQDSSSKDTPSHQK